MPGLALVLIGHRSSQRSVDDEAGTLYVSEGGPVDPQHRVGESGPPHCDAAGLPASITVRPDPCP